ncbi:sulfatase-like hydrolase/transferase, partial [candidate division KSB3 bacterium]|nr:sulfatase-like hydrolase/transferase [candidate division KSB3 bacterium]MBD3323555.1 sulfatase-like hydrolase/transferase [candidate division KSB3 bacterium]
MSQITNILFITTDQQRQDSLPCYGLDFMQTPALDRLAHEGIVFD